MTVSVESLSICQASNVEDIQPLRLNFQKPKVGYWHDTQYHYGAITIVRRTDTTAVSIDYAELTSQEQFTISYTPALYPYRIPTIYSTATVSATGYRYNVSGEVVSTYPTTIQQNTGVSFGALVGAFGDGYVPYQTGYFGFDDGGTDFPLMSYKGYNSALGSYAQPMENVAVWETVLTQKTYKSYTSKPVADEHNRYLILGTEEESYLYWLTLKQYQLEYVDSTETVDLTKSGSPYNITVNVGQEITMGWTYDTLDYASAPLAQLKYSVVLTRYDLETGEYQNSWSYTGTLTSQSEQLALTGAFDETYTAIESVGLYCSVTIPLNRASIVWSYNPLFEQWKEEQSQYLQRIIALLEKTGEDVTISQEQQAIDSASEAVQDLQIKDENGSVMKADEEASKAFEQAQQGIQELASPVQQLGESISDVFADNILYVPVIVALALGLLVTILGKNKSD